MGSRIAKHVWDNISHYQVSPTEASVLIALAFFANDQFGYCHPLQTRVEEKTGLKATAVKKATKALERKGLISCTRKPAHVTEYRIDCASNRGTPQPPDGGTGSDSRHDQTARAARLEKKANLLLAKNFAALLADPKRRTNAVIDYVLLLDECGFEAGLEQLRAVKAESKNLPDGEIHALVLARLKNLAGN